MIRVGYGILTLFRQRRLLAFLKDSQALRAALKRELIGPETFFFFTSKSLPLYFRGALSRPHVRVGDIPARNKLVDSISALSDEDLERICSFYHKASGQTPTSAGDPYFIGGLWEDWRVNHQSHMIRALVERDYQVLRRIFGSIGGDEVSRGISFSGDHASDLYQRIMKVNRLNVLLSLHKKIYPTGSIAHYPVSWGSFPGARLKGGVMIPSGPRMSHNARQLSALSVACGSRNKILEIGGALVVFPIT